MALTTLATVIKVNSIDGVDTVGGDGTYGYASFQYAIDDQADLGATGTTIEVVGDFTLSAALDYTGWATAPVEQTKRRTVIGVGRLTVGDGLKPTITTSAQFDSSGHNGLSFINLDITTSHSSGYLMNGSTGTHVQFCDVSGTNTAGVATTSTRGYFIGNTVDCPSASAGLISTTSGIVLGNSVRVGRAALYISTSGCISFNSVVVETAATDIAIKMNGDYGQCTHNTVYAANGCTSGISINAGALNDWTAAMNYVEGFTNGIDGVSTAYPGSVFGNIMYNNTTDYDAVEAFAESNNTSASYSLLMANKFIASNELMQLIPGIGAPVNQLHFRRRLPKLRA